MCSRFKSGFLFFIFFILISKVGAVDVIKVDGKTEKINVSEFSELFVDSQRHFSYDDVSSNTFNDNFKPLNAESVSAGYTDDTIWTRFDIQNKGEKTFTGKIEMPAPWVSKIDVYVKIGEALSVANFGSALPSKEKEIDSRAFFLPVTIEPSQTVTIYIRAEGTSAITLAPQLYSQKKASERITYIAMFNGALIGIILIMFFYNLNNYLTYNKDENYAYFLLHLVGLLFLMGIYYGYNLQLFWSDSPIFNENIHYPIVAFSFFAGLFFTRNFLKSSENFAKSDSYLVVLLGASVLLSVAGLIMDNNLVMVYATLFFTIIYFLSIMYISVASYYKKISGSIYLLLGWLFLAVGQLVSSLLVLGFIDYDDCIYDFYGVAVALNILMISFALVSRNRDSEAQCEFEVQKEHEIAEKLNLSKKELRELSEKLKRKVEIQERELLEKSSEYEKFSIKDDVTGLYNKVKLEEIVSSELHRSKRYNYEFSLIVINIDELKSINDTHGFQVGNSVMKEMADIFIKNIRYLDTVGRWSEQEYLIICPETNAEHAVIAAQHLQKLVEKNKFFFVGTATACFGVTQCQITDTLQDLMKRAYNALDNAKVGGRNRVEML